MKKSSIQRAQEKLIEYFAQSPELSKILRMFPKISLKPILFTKKRNKGADDYLWANAGKIIQVSIDAKTLRVLPEDPQEQKFLLAHEIGHSKITWLDLREIGDCETHRLISTPEYRNCLFEEILASKIGVGILKRLNLLNGEEEKIFWQWVAELETQEPYPQCLDTAKRKSCPLRKRLNLILKKLRKYEAAKG